MANAKRRRTQRTDDDNFDMLLSDALPQLLPARHIVAGASWLFTVEGSGADARLVIIRSVPTVTIPDPES
jgi:hypothetical protein